MSKEQQFVPFSEANTRRIRTHLRLPYRLEQNIGLDVLRLEKLAQIGGIATVKIGNGSETDRSTPQILGVDASGRAVGALTLTSVRSPYSSDNYIDYPVKDPASVWSHLEIRLDQERAISMMELQKKDIREATNWSNLINSGIKRGLIRSGTQNLLKRHLFQYIWLPITLDLWRQGIVRREYSTVGFVLGATILSHILVSIRRGFEKDGTGKRWTLFFADSPEVDRMLFLLSLLPFQSLTKKIF